MEKGVVAKLEAGKDVPTMNSDVAIRKVKDLQPGVKQAIQDLLGRPLRAEEQLSIRVSTTHKAPPPATKVEAQVFGLVAP